jgi:hypothetical protein
MNIAKLRAALGRVLGRRVSEGFLPKMHWEIECVGPDGTVKWTECGYNLIVDTGINDALDKWLKGSSYTAAFYVGLTSSSPTPNAADTMSSHGGWTEVTAYSESVRQTLTLGSVSAKSVSNTGSKAVFTINSNSTTVGGAFLATNSTKGGTSGTLISVKAFTGGNKTADTDDVLNVTVTVTGSSS